MKLSNNILIVFLLFFSIQLFGQPFKSSLIKHDFTNLENSIRFQIHSKDIDGDYLDDLIYIGDKNIYLNRNLNNTDGLFSNTELLIEGDDFINEIYITDLDSDSDNDIIIKTRTLIGYYENDGSGNFNRLKNIVNSNNEIDNYNISDDYDNDYDIDITCMVDGVNYVFINNGLGTFGRKTITGLEGVPIFENIDVNNDGKKDLICVENGYRKLYLRDFDYHFTFSTNLYSGYKKFTEFHDIDNDTRNDLLYLSDNSGELYYKSQEENGNFSNSPWIILDTFPIVTSYNSSWIFSDFNGDNVPDIIFYDYREGILYLENNGDFTFKESELIFDFVDYNLSFPYNLNFSLNLSDIDNDGNKEVVFAVGQIYSVEYNGIGFEEPIKRTNRDYSIAPWHVDGFDIGNDGDIDILAEDGNYFGLFENNGDNEYGDFQAISNHLELDGGRNFNLIDIDNDGDNDIIRSIEKYSQYNGQNISQGTIILHENDGNNNFGNEKVIKKLSNYVYGDSFDDLKYGDFNNDGFIDIVASTFLGDLIYLLTNDGNNNFSGITINNPFTDSPSKLEVGDFNNDGLLDFLCNGHVYNDPVSKLYYFENLGNSSFSFSLVYESLTNPDSPIGHLFHIDDLNKDSNLDIIIYDNVTREQIKVMNNNGDGTFETPIVFHSEYIEHDFYSNPISIENIFDYDKDGDNDYLISFNPCDEPPPSCSRIATYFILKNDDNYNFTKKILSHIEYIYFKNEHFFDFNNDGEEDCFYLKGNDIYLIENLENKPKIGVKVFYDENDNGLLENNEREITEAQINISPEALLVLSSNSNNFTSSSGSEGINEIILDEGTYEFSAEIDSNWTQTTIPISYNIDVYDSLGIDSILLFGFKPLNEINDLDLFVTANAITRCGTDVPFNITYTNSGTTILNGYITVTNEHLIDFNQSLSTPPDSISGNQLFWKFNDLYPNESASITLFYTIGDQSNVGDSLELEVKATIPIMNNSANTYPNPPSNATDKVDICHCTGSETNPYVILNVPPSAIDGQGNNDHSHHDCDIIPITDRNGDGQITVLDCTTEKPSYEEICFTGVYQNIIRCSYDPNDKTANPFGVGAEHYTLMDQDLMYTIRFQNNGNDTAFHVQVKDSLDVNLDVTTFEFLSASHDNLNIAIQTYNEGLSNEYHELIFTFDPILLVDSMTNYNASQGYIIFSIRPKANVPENTVINNKASIVFDEFVNFPIITNETENTLVSQLDFTSINEIDKEWLIGIEVAPNPFIDNINVSLTKPDNINAVDISITTIDGKKIYVQPNVLENDLTLYLPNLSKGVYLIAIQDAKTKELIGLKKVVTVK